MGHMGRIINAYKKCQKTQTGSYHFKGGVVDY